MTDKFRTLSSFGSRLLEAKLLECTLRAVRTLYCDLVAVRTTFEGRSRGHDGVDGHGSPESRRRDRKEKCRGRGKGKGPEKSKESEKVRANEYTSTNSERDDAIMDLDERERSGNDANDKLESTDENRRGAQDEETIEGDEEEGEEEGEERFNSLCQVALEAVFAIAPNPSSAPNKPESEIHHNLYTTQNSRSNKSFLRALESIIRECLSATLHTISKPVPTPIFSTTTPSSPSPSSSTYVFSAPRKTAATTISLPTHYYFTIADLILTFYAGTAPHFINLDLDIDLVQDREGIREGSKAQSRPRSRLAWRERVVRVVMHFVLFGGNVGRFVCSTSLLCSARGPFVFFFLFPV